jgi:hypothetical protein
MHAVIFSCASRLDVLFLEGFPTEILYEFLIFSMHATYYTHLILLRMITLIISYDIERYNGNAVVFYLGGTPFEYRPKHQLS